MDKEVLRKSGTGGRRWVLILSALVLGLALMALRYCVIEQGLLPRDCGPTGQDSAWPCGLSWLLVQSFRVHRLGWLEVQPLGWLALACGALGFLFFRLRSLAWVGWLAGVAGLVLYCPDTAAVGALLGLFTLLRERRGPDEHGQRQRETSQ